MLHLNDAYRLLNCDESKTIDEIKSEYRKLVLQYHPDVNKSSTTDMMQRLNSAWDLIKKNHVQKIKVKINLEQKPILYRVIDLKSVSISLPQYILDESDTIIWCMYDDREFRFELPKSFQLPAVIKILGIKLTIKKD